MAQSQTDIADNERAQTSWLKAKQSISNLRNAGNRLTTWYHRLGLTDLTERREDGGRLCGPVLQFGNMSLNRLLERMLQRGDSNFVLGNAQAREHPIVYCSDGFCELTGFTRANIMSRSCACRFLWGKDTGEDEVKKIDNALSILSELKTEVVFYRKNGSPFVCLLDIVPIKNEKGQVVLFLASHKDVTREKANMDAAGNGELRDLNQTSSDEETDEGEEGDTDEDDDEPSSAYKYQRRRSRAVLYHLSGQYSNKSKGKIQLNRQLQNFSGKNALPEYKVQEMKKSRFVLLHYGLFKIGWDWLILLCTFYIAMMVPYNAAFLSEPGDKDLIVCDLIVEFLFIIDIIFNFRTTYVTKGGQVEYNTRLIALNYFKGWFILDLLAAVPFDFIIAFQNLESDRDSWGSVGHKIHFGPSSEHASTSVWNQWGPKIHLMKLARLLRLARLMQKIERYSHYSSVVLALLTSMFALAAHWLACVWYVIGIDELQSNRTWNVGWLFELGERTHVPYTDNGTGGPTKHSKYITALYFTCSSLTSVGFGNVSPNTNMEKVFSIIAMLVGALMHAAVFGNVTAIIQRMYGRRAAYDMKTKDLKDFMRMHHIPKALKQRMQEFFQTMWSINHGISPGEILRDFPEELRGDIALHMHRDVLSMTLFESACQGCLKALANHIKSAFSTPGEYLVHKGDALKYFYFVCNGSLEVLKEDMVVAILGKGDFFGTDIPPDISLVPRSSCDVRSLTYCDLQCMELRGIVEVLEQYPEYSKKFEEDLQNELTYNMREDDDERTSTSGSPNHKLGPTLPSITEDDEDDLKEIEEDESPVSTTILLRNSPTDGTRHAPIDVRLSPEIGANRFADKNTRPSLLKFGGKFQSRENSRFRPNPHRRFLHRRMDSSPALLTPGRNHRSLDEDRCYGYEFNSSHDVSVVRSELQKVQQQISSLEGKFDQLQVAVVDIANNLSRVIYSLNLASRTSEQPTSSVDNLDPSVTSFPLSSHSTQSSPTSEFLNHPSQGPTTSSIGADIGRSHSFETALQQPITAEEFQEAESAGSNPSIDSFEASKAPLLPQDRVGHICCTDL